MDVMDVCDGCVWWMCVMDVLYDCVHAQFSFYINSFFSDWIFPCFSTGCVTFCITIISPETGSFSWKLCLRNLERFWFERFFFFVKLQHSDSERLWTWLSWRGKRKLPNEYPLDHCVKQWASKGAFPLFLYSILWQFQFHFKNSTFPGLGFESQSRKFFRFFFFFELSATVNQWKIFFEELCRLVNMSCHWSHITKDCPHWDSNPWPGNVELTVRL